MDIERIAAGADGSLDDEYVVLENTGYRPRSLDGWTVSNGSGATYTFGRQVLLPGETVTLYTGEGTDNRSAVYWGRVVGGLDRQRDGVADGRRRRAGDDPAVRRVRRRRQLRLTGDARPPEVCPSATENTACTPATPAARS